MATTPASWHEDFLGRLGRLRRSLEAVQLVSGAAWFLATALALATIAAFLEMVLVFGPAGRSALVVSLVIAWFLLLAGFLGVPLFKRLGLLSSLTNEKLAGLVGSAFPEVRDRLLNLLQLHADDRGHYSPDLIDDAGRTLADDIQSFDFIRALDRSPIRRSRKTLFFVAGGIILAVALFPQSFPAAVNRLVHFGRPFAPVNGVFFVFDAESNQIVKGSAFSTIVRVLPISETHPIDPLAPLTFLWKPENQATPTQILVHPDSPGVYRATVADVRRNAEYSALLGGFQSEYHAVTVLDLPALRSFRVQLEYPRYTGLPPKVQEDFVGDITALPGTRVKLTGMSSNDLTSAEIHFTDGTSLPALVRGRSFSVQFPVTATTGYALDLADTKGLRLADPISYSITLIEDAPPTIELLQPGRNLDIAEGGTLPLLVRIGDDYGFSSLRLLYRLTQSRYERPWEESRVVDIPLPPATRTTADISYPWSLDPLDLVPEDALEYALEVFDNDIIHGPKSARTPLFLLRLPSLDEVFADAETTQRLSLDEMQQTLQDAEELKETVDKIEQDMKQNKPLDWQQQKTLEEVTKKYTDIQKSLEKVQEELAQMVSSMQQQDALSVETLEKYLELQELFEQLDSAELQQTLQQLQQAMQNVNRQQLQEAMQRLTFSEDRFRASIERTINLLKRIQIEQKLDEAIRRTEEVRNRQSALSKQTAADSLAATDHDRLAQQQEDLEQAQRELEEATRDVQERMEEFFAEMPLDRMEEVNRQLQQQQLSQQMDRSAQQLRSGQQQAAQKTQGQILQQLDHLSDDLRAIQQQLLEQQSLYTINALRQAALNLLELSRRQEGLKNESARSQANSPGLRQNAQDQTRALETLTRVAQSLAELGQRSFAVTPQMARSIGEALRAMQNALRSLDLRNAQATSRSQTDAMGALNSSAMAVQDALEALMQGGSGGGSGGLMQQLQTLAGQQQSLNAQTQSMEAAAQAARLAAEQAAIQKSLEQLNQEAQRAGESDRLLGDLERLAQEMREVVRSLEQENVSPETVQRQERILSRLLDASRSLRERDFEKRRKATTGSPVARTGPPELDERLTQDRDRLRNDLLRALEQGYSKEYEELIRKYFEELQKLEQERP